MRFYDRLKAERIRDGDVEAFEEVINHHKLRVFNYCQKMSRNYHIAEELTQEVFVKVYRHIGGYDWRKASLSTWIFVITRRTCLNHLRDSQSERLPEPGPAGRTPEEHLLAEEERRWLIEALDALAPDDREIIIMKDYLGLKYREIGKIVGIPAGTVKSRLHTIREKIRRQLGDRSEQ